MSTHADLEIPRRLAIRILHEAQIAQPESIRGVVGARDGVPVSFVLAPALPAAGQTLWARLWSNPNQAAVPSADQLAPDGLFLVVSLNTKGVLEMRAWELRDGAPLERVLKVRD